MLTLPPAPRRLCPALPTEFLPAVMPLRGSPPRLHATTPGSPKESKPSAEPYPLQFILWFSGPGLAHTEQNQSNLPGGREESASKLFSLPPRSGGAPRAGGDRGRTAGSGRSWSLSKPHLSPLQPPRRAGGRSPAAQKVPGPRGPSARALGASPTVCKRGAAGEKGAQVMVTGQRVRFQRREEVDKGELTKHECVFIAARWRGAPLSLPPSTPAASFYRSCKWRAGFFP